MTNKLHLTFIINPIAGKGRAGNMSDVIEKCIDKTKFTYKILFSEKAGHIKKITKEALQSGTDIIIAVGGDGTVNEVARHIVHTDVILGIIPVGSGNGLGNYLKIPHNYEQALDTINAFHVKKIDTGTINNHFFVSVAGIGFDASVAKEYAKSKSRGFKTYLRSTIRKYFRYKPAKYKIRIGDIVIKRRALLITFANSDQFGYNTSIAPHAIIDDGFFDMCIMRKVPIFAAPLVVPRLFTRKIHKSVYHESHKVSEATVFRKRTSVIQVDGEAMKMKDKIIKVTNHPLSLWVICPESHEPSLSL
jgi:diacylglycerol kinase (ATP)